MELDRTGRDWTGKRDGMIRMELGTVSDETGTNEPARNGNRLGNTMQQEMCPNRKRLDKVGRQNATRLKRIGQPG